MGVAPQYLLELDHKMLSAIIEVYKEKSKAIEDASKRKRGRRA
jgi:hypothetical protein